MVAREDQRLLEDQPLPPLAIVDLLFLLLDKHVVSENVEELIPLQHLLPEVAATVAGWMLWVTSPALHLAGMAPPVERQEVGRLLTKPGGHVNLYRVCGKMYQRPRLKAEERRTGIAV